MTRELTVHLKKCTRHPCCATSPPLHPVPCYFYPWLLIVVKMAYHPSRRHRPLWRTLSLLTSACPSLLCNQRSSEMSRWDKWEPFPTVMAPEMCRGAFFSCPSLSIFSLSEKTQAFSALSSFRLVYVPRFLGGFFLYISHFSIFDPSSVLSQGLCFCCVNMLNLFKIRCITDSLYNGSE